MTTDPISPEDGPVEGSLVFDVPEVDHTQDVVPFYLNDDDTVLYAKRPKKAKLLTVVQQVNALDSTVDDLQGAGMLDGIMKMILTEESVEYLDSRFQDEDDDLDLDVLGPIFKRLVELWYGGPTGGRRASSPRPRPAGRRSTAPSRSGV